MMSEQPIQHEPLPEPLRFLEQYSHKPGIASSLPGLLARSRGEQLQVRQSFLWWKRHPRLVTPTPIEVEADRVRRKRIETQHAYSAMQEDPRFAQLKLKEAAAWSAYNQVADERGWGVLGFDDMSKDEQARVQEESRRRDEELESARQELRRLDSEYGLDRHPRSRVPDGWEGDVEHDVMTLPHLAHYLAKRLAWSRNSMKWPGPNKSEEYPVSLLGQAVRNAHRLFDFLRVRDRPPRPSARFSDFIAAESNAADLLEWVRERVKNGRLSLDDVAQRLENGWEAYRGMMQESGDILGPLLFGFREEIDWKVVVPYLDARRFELGLDFSVEENAINERALAALNEMLGAAAAFDDTALDSAIANALAMHKEDRKQLRYLAADAARTVRWELRAKVMQQLADAFPLPGQHARDLVEVLRQRQQLPGQADEFPERLVAFSSQKREELVTVALEAKQLPPARSGRQHAETELRPRKRKAKVELASLETESHPAPTAVSNEATAETSLSETGAVEESGHQNSFKKSGDVWEIVFAGRRRSLGKSIGLRYIHKLLMAPYIEIPAMVLAGSSMDLAKNASHELSTDDGLRRIYQELREAESGLAEAQRIGDATEAEFWSRQQDDLRAHLNSVVGKGDAMRKFKNEVERSRNAVGMAISRAIEKIRDELPDLAQHLHQSILKGAALKYEPIQTPDWIL